MNTGFEATVVIGTIALLIVGAIGYVINIIDLVHATALTGLVVGRIVGIVIPFIGSILGLFA